MRVLLVEDEPTLAQCIELMLRSESFEVVTAVLGQGAHPPRPARTNRPSSTCTCQIFRLRVLRACVLAGHNPF